MGKLLELFRMSSQDRSDCLVHFCGDRMSKRWPTAERSIFVVRRLTGCKAVWFGLKSAVAPECMTLYRLEPQIHQKCSPGLPARCQLCAMRAVTPEHPDCWLADEGTVQRIWQLAR